MAKMLRNKYDIMALGLLGLYFLMPLWSYVIFWGLFPKIRLTPIFGILLVPVLAIRLWLLVTKKYPFPDKRYALLWVLLLLVTIIQIAWAPTLLSQIGANAYLLMVAFSVGAYVFLLGAEPLAFQVAASGEWSRFIWNGILVIYAGLILMIVYGVARYFFNFHQLLFLFVLYNPKRIYNYQVLSDTFAIISLLMMARYGATGLFQRLVIYGISALFLFFSYSRASVAAFLIAGGLLIVIQSWKHNRQRKILFGIAFGGALFLSIMAIGFGALSKNAENTGFLSLIVQRFFSMNTFRNPSFQGRLQYWNQSLPLLKSYWLMGRFMYEVVLFKRGAYIHNWMSFWLAYGILPFLLSLVLLFWTFVTALKQCFSNPWAPLACVLLLFNIIMIAIARPYIWVYFWFALAFPMALVGVSNWRENEENCLSSALE